MCSPVYSVLTSYARNASLIGMAKYHLSLALIVTVTCIDGLIIPNELPTILSLIYSNIPPLKIGQDTRFGVGFRLGPHADFQTLIELGPQSNTRPIGTEAQAKRDAADTSSVRNDFAFLPRPQRRPRPKPDANRPHPVIKSEVKVDEMKKKVPTKKTSSILMDKIVFNKVPGIDS